MALTAFCIKPRTWFIEERMAERSLRTFNGWPDIMKYFIIKSWSYSGFVKYIILLLMK
jgi:hypothetical protein